MSKQECQSAINQCRTAF